MQYLRPSYHPSQVGSTEQAVAYLDRALQAPARPGRQVSDSGRREEVRALLEKIKAK